MIEQEQKDTDSQDEFWDYVNELAEKYEITCDYVLEEFLV